MSQTPSPSSSFKILLVENSRTARAVLVKLLENEGYAVETVNTGAQAIEALDQRDYDLMIMDLFMPELNGYEAAQKIRSLDTPKAKIPIIGFSSSTNERDKKLCLDSGMNDFVEKSEKNDSLLFVLDQFRHNIAK